MFLFAAFLGVRDTNLLLDIAFWATVKKVVAQLILVPFAIYIINVIRSKEDENISSKRLSH